ncbi:MAG: hypothetical protein RL226_1524 [Bacteroidota bacterium]|jgi:membrane protein implicated in regulation of membrane protease activity
MMEFFEGMDSVLKTFWFIALPASLIFIFQTIATFIGADAGDGLEADFDGDMDGDGGFQIFSFRNLINFLLGFGWAGVSFYSLVSNTWLLMLIAFAVGVAFVMMFFMIIRQLMKLSEDNSFKMTDTLNQTAEVYLPIPENMSGKGKVLISVRGSMHELDAITEGDRIPQSKLVKVVGIENERILIVTPL